MSRNQHVVKRDDEWAVIGERNKKDTSHHDTQKEAIDAATTIAKNQGGDVIVHDKEGKIRDRNTYGKHDPFPPKG